jgi:hypothetical protein
MGRWDRRLFTIPVLRYMKTYGLTHEQLAMVSVVQRQWTAKNPRATFKTPITVEDVLSSSPRAFRIAGAKAFAEAGIIHDDVDHLMTYETPCSLPGASFAHLPIYGLEDLGFLPARLAQVR